MAPRRTRAVSCPAVHPGQVTPRTEPTCTSGGARRPPSEHGTHNAVRAHATAARRACSALAALPAATAVVASSLRKVSRLASVFVLGLGLGLGLWLGLARARRPYP